MTPPPILRPFVSATIPNPPSCGAAIDVAGRAHFAAGLAAVIGLSMAMTAALSLRGGAVAVAAGLYAMLLTLLWGSRVGAPPAGFGAANRVTLVRAALVSALAGLLAAGDAMTISAVAWGAVAVASLAAALDLADGWLARRGAQSSSFGARFDMETDALLILVLSALAAQAGKAGWWILGAGLLRYAFLAASLAWPVLARPLPHSERRRVVCAAQVVVLIICLAPIVPPAVSSAIAAAALAALTMSFATDTAYLLRAQGGRT